MSIHLALQPALLRRASRIGLASRIHQEDTGQKKT
jgi:hypothetical protein